MIQIGETAYHATVERVRQPVTCPDCAGQRYLTVILGNWERVAIKCALCSQDAEGQYPTGFVYEHEYLPKVTNFVVTGMEIRKDQPTKYYGDDSRYYNEDVCASEHEAHARSLELAKQRDTKSPLWQKEKAHQSWAWHVSYYRKQVRDSIRSAIRYSKQLDFARQCAGKSA